MEYVMQQSVQAFDLLLLSFEQDIDVPTWLSGQTPGKTQAIQPAMSQALPNDDQRGSSSNTEGSNFSL